MEGIFLIKHLKQVFLDIFYPKKCIICNFVFDTFCCENCKKILKPYFKIENHIGFEKIISLYDFNDIVKDLIHNFKYNKIQELGNIFIEQAKEIIYKNKTIIDFENSILIPVPLYKKRLYERGFNQSEVLANEIGKILNIEVCTDLIYRDKNTLNQALLNKVKRQKNVKDAFLINKNNKIQQIQKKYIILVDDVFTTGSTMLSCVNVIKNNLVKSHQVMNENNDIKFYGLVLVKKEL